MLSEIRSDNQYGRFIAIEKLKGTSSVQSSQGNETFKQSQGQAPFGQFSNEYPPPGSNYPHKKEASNSFYSKDLPSLQPKQPANNFHYPMQQPVR